MPRLSIELSAAWAVIGWCTASPIAAAEDSSASRPNIVLVMADDQGWGETGYNGHPHLKTPVLDEMAARGLRFDRFYAASPNCSPTRASVMTGRHANRSGAFAPNYLLADPKETTNISSQHPDVVKRMTAELHQWQRSVEQSLTGADY